MLLLETTVAGLAGGGAYALLGLAMLLTYRLVRVVNFTQAAVGAFGAYVMVVMWEGGVPLGVAVVAGVLVGAALHTLVGLVMVRWFSEASEGVKAAVTVALLSSFLAIGERFFGTQFLHRWPDPLRGRALSIVGVGVTWGVVVTVVLAVAFAAGAALFLDRTRTGMLLRAVSSRPTTAELVGIAAPRLALAVWAFAGAATAFAIMLVAPQFSQGYANLALLITWGFATALVGAFHSFWLTLAGGLGLGALQGLLSSLQSIKEYRGVLPLVVILAVLVWSRRKERWEAAA